MTTTVKAVFENGVFRPTEAVPFKEGEHVEITASSRLESERATTPGAAAYEALSRIAGMPDDGPDDAFTGGDHDAVLYGGEEGPK